MSHDSVLAQVKNPYGANAEKYLQSFICEQIKKGVTSAKDILGKIKCEEKEFLNAIHMNKKISLNGDLLSLN